MFPSQFGTLYLLTCLVVRFHLTIRHFHRSLRRLQPWLRALPQGSHHHQLKLRLHPCTPVRYQTIFRRCDRLRFHLTFRHQLVLRLHPCTPVRYQAIVRHHHRARIRRCGRLRLHLTFQHRLQPWLRALSQVSHQHQLVLRLHPCTPVRYPSIFRRCGRLRFHLTF
jgi:hypothetical protein